MWMILGIPVPKTRHIAKSRHTNFAGRVAAGLGAARGIAVVTSNLNVALGQCLTPHGYTQWTSYQPASRFWAFQWIESGWLLWLVRRRAA
jgi:hypothetical protein